MSKFVYKFTIFLLFSIIVFSCSGGGKSSSNTSTDSSFKIDTNLSGETFFALYMVGSDLESDGDAGTTDLLELIDGYNKLTDLVFHR